MSDEPTPEELEAAVDEKLPPEAAATIASGEAKDDDPTDNDVTSVRFGAANSAFGAASSAAKSPGGGGKATAQQSFDESGNKTTWSNDFLQQRQKKQSSKATKGQEMQKARVARLAAGGEHFVGIITPRVKPGPGRPRGPTFPTVIVETPADAPEITVQTPHSANSHYIEGHLIDDIQIPYKPPLGMTMVVDRSLIRVDRLKGGSPSWATHKIKPGDYILEINGKEVGFREGMSEEQLAKKPLEVAVSAINISKVDASKNKEVHIKLLRPRHHVGRPKGSKNSKLTKIKPKPQKEMVYPNARVKSTVERAKTKMQSKIDGLFQAQNSIAAQEETIRRAQEKIEKERKNVEKWREAVQHTAEHHADELVMEPTDWNLRYQRLLAFKEKHGVDISHLTRIKKVIEETYDKEEDRKEHRILAKWVGTQRSLKKKDLLEPYQLVLLERIPLNWDPPQGPTGEKWMRKMNHLKMFLQQNGHVNIPEDYPPEPRLKEWWRSQKTLYHTMKEGRPVSGFTEERARIMEELGVDLGVKRKAIPWETRFTDLVEYRKRYGHCNVPWRWTGNRPLAGWVNDQRKKYVDRFEKGKKTNLTDDHIRRLEALGFRWKSNGKRSYGAVPGDGKGQAAMSQDGLGTDAEQIYRAMKRQKPNPDDEEEEEEEVDEVTGQIAEAENLLMEMQQGYGEI